MSASRRRLRRSVLTTPGSSEKMLIKAAASAADYVIIDLEDSVAPTEKAGARTAACAAVNDLDWGQKTIGVRVNAVGTPWVLDDLLAIGRTTGARVDVITVPKVLRADDVRFVSRVLDHVAPESDHAVGIDVLVEEARALARLHTIVKTSSRLEALVFGPGDYAASIQGAESPWRTDLVPSAHSTFARQSIVVAARAAGLVPIDGPYADFQDSRGFKAEAEEARRSGFAGKWVIHPSQIDAANEVFSPTPGEAERARAICAAYVEAQHQGLGAVAIDGKLVDAANVRIAQEIVALCGLIGI
ncbi:MAG: HpcH/HpaI aldolase/citrate lyase family protein [Mycobacteriaceae bacterium]